MPWSSQGGGCAGGSVRAQGSPVNPGGSFGEGVLGESPRGSLWAGPPPKSHDPRRGPFQLPALPPLSPLFI